LDPSFFFKGMALGLSIAAPVGPIGVLCIRRTLADGARMGFAAGLGAATADAAYGCVAGFSLTVISGFLVRQQVWLALLGGGFLCYLGVCTFLSRPAQESSNVKRGGWFTTYFSTVLLTLANPATILSFVAAFAGFGVGTSADYQTAGSLVLGVFLGSALWWLILSGGVGLLRSRMKSSWMQAINRFSGGVLFAFGLYALSKVWPG
jgi:threonine/homoserine/homoserine lactone efflux protein